MLDLPLACLWCAEPVPVKDSGRQAEYCCREHYVAHAAQIRVWTQGAAKRGPRECPTCSQQLPARPLNAPGRLPSYCSRECQRRRPKPPKPPKVLPLVPCVTCGREFRRRNITYRFCSSLCGDVHRGQRRAAPLPVRTCALPSCGAEYQPKRDEQRCCGEEHSKKLWHIENPGAGEWTDARRDAYHRRRALKAKTSTGRPVRLAEIRERDGNRCHLCRKTVSNKAWPHPLSASMDHVIPLSRGGIHDPDNVKLAHLRCNVEKGNRGGNEQLLLIG